MTLVHIQHTQELGQASPTLPFWEGTMSDICTHSAHPEAVSSIFYSTIAGGQNE